MTTLFLSDSLSYELSFREISYKVLGVCVCDVAKGIAGKMLISVISGMMLLKSCYIIVLLMMIIIL